MVLHTNKKLKECTSFFQASSLYVLSLMVFSGNLIPILLFSYWKRKGTRNWNHNEKNILGRLFVWQSSRENYGNIWVSSSMQSLGNFIIPDQLFCSRTWHNWLRNPFCRSWQGNISKAITTSRQRTQSCDSSSQTSYWWRSQFQDLLERSSPFHYWIWLCIWGTGRRKQRKSDYVYAGKDPFFPSSLFTKPDSLCFLMEGFNCVINHSW